MPVRPAALVLLLAAGPAAAQTVTLTETPKPGDGSRYAIDLDVSGHLSVAGEGGKPQQLTLAAKARHRFADRTLAVADGQPAKSARHYAEAVASGVVAGEKADRALGAGRRLVVAARTADGRVAYSPAGPLTRDERDLVTEHFDPACLPGLLPGKAVKVGDTWAVADPAARTACLFDALVKNGLTGTLTGVADGVALFSVAGTAEGIENGGRVTSAVTATGRFHVASGRLVGLTWKQSDDRGAGAVHPAAKVEAAVTLTREVLTAVPPELADAALAGVPAGDPPAALTALRHADPRGRYSLVYRPEWHVTGQTDAHLVLRLLDRGEFVAQATVTAWRAAAAGAHDTPDELKKAAGATAGWKPGRVVADGEVPAGGGRWLYRLVVEGTMDGAAVVQAFYLLAGPGGGQVVVTVALPPDKLAAVGGRDLDLVRGVEFGK